MTNNRIPLGRDYVASTKQKWSQRGRSGEWDKIVKDPKSYVNTNNAQALFADRLVSIVKKFTEQTRVLDIGCGTGNMTEYIAPLIDNKNIIGIDMAEGMIERAQEKFQDINWLVLECLNMPFEKEYFNVIFSRGVMPSHLGQVYWRDVCKECFGLLKKTGYLMFDYLNSEYQKQQPNHKTIYNQDQMKKVFAGIGYEEYKFYNTENKNAIVLLRK